MKIILASQSPRRKELIELMGIKEYDVIASDIEEKMNDDLGVIDKVKKLSYEKAKSVFNKTTGDRIVIGSDTIVEKDNIIYGKPKDKQEATDMLKKFRNSKVNIITGLAVLIEQSGKISRKIDYDLSEVYIKSMTDEEIENWIDTKKAFDKAGAFGVQDEFCVYIEKINGNYHSIVGLPTSKLYDIIKKYIDKK